jgi:hypothetical protein
VIARYNNISLALGVPGLILQVAGNIMVQSNKGNELAEPSAGILVGALVAGPRVALDQKTGIGAKSPEKPAVLVTIYC